MNTKITTVSAVLLRLLLGWYMLFDGLEAVLNPGWSAQGFLLSAKTFPGFYAWFASPMNLWWVNPLNSWGITLVGVALIAGVCVRPAALAAAAMHILYYFPHYVFPQVPHGFIVEDHIIYAVVFVFIAFYAPAQRFSLGAILRRSFLGSVPVIKSLL